jgi:hypothetical protein
MKRILTTVLCLLALHPPAPAQTPPEAEPPVKIRSIELRQGTPPSASKPWTKVVCSFDTTPEWMDGLTLGFEVLLRAPPQDGRKALPRIATGSTTFVNVPKGANTAIMYLPTATLKRFGEPWAIRVSAVTGDNEAGFFEWKNPGSEPPKTWATDYERVSGLLLPVRFTPFLLTDHELMPDTLPQ